MRVEPRAIVRCVWRPTTWHDLVLALGQRHEDQQLDFKRELPSNARDLAKDAAAMSIDGGVIVIGVDENAGVASAILPLPLQGVVERLRQLIDSHVEPKLEVEISMLRDNPNDGDGVVVITVPKSESGPHQYDGRFPARSGPTTRYLGASEVAALYAGPATESAESSNPIDEFVAPPGAGTGGFVGVGRMKLQVSPAREFQHPDQPRLGPAARSCGGCDRRAN